ncbi:MAG: hypothetical protein ABIJ00_12455, partial [Candidatus Eisenbacteria bacterium]
EEPETVPITKDVPEYYDKAVAKREASIRNRIPGCLAVDLDLDGCTLSITTRDEFKDWQRVFDEEARWSGTLPYWEELLARDLKSPHFSASLFSLRGVIDVPKRSDGLLSYGEPGDPQHTVTFYSFVGGEGRTAGIQRFSLESTDGTYTLTALASPERVPWEEMESLRKKPSSEVTVRLPDGVLGKARLNRLTAYCMCHDRLALRIYDGSGQCVWEDTSSLHGYCLAWSADFRKDGVDEIVVFQDDHGSASLLVFGPPSPEAPNKPLEGTPASAGSPTGTE